MVREALELRVGRGARLSGTHAKDFREVPPNAWMFLIGQPPEALRFLPPFRVLPRSLMMALSGNRAVAACLRAGFATPGEAEKFAANLDGPRKLGLAFAKCPLVARNAESSALLARTLNGLWVEARGEHARADV